MTRWHVVHGDLLDIEADGLICSANPQLNLSGGVGGAILLRYGTAMQDFLHNYLQQNSLKHVAPGSVVVTPCYGTGFKAVAHAVAIDAFYDSRAELVKSCYLQAIEYLAAAGCRSIAAACLACGYGRLATSEFEKSVASLIANRFANVDDITLATTNESLVASLRLLIPES